MNSFSSDLDLSYQIRSHRIQAPRVPLPRFFPHRISFELSSICVIAVPVRFYLGQLRSSNSSTPVWVIQARQTPPIRSITSKLSKRLSSHFRAPIFLQSSRHRPPVNRRPRSQPISSPQQRLDLAPVFTFTFSSFVYRNGGDSEVAWSASKRLFPWRIQWGRSSQYQAANRKARYTFQGAINRHTLKSYILDVLDAIPTSYSATDYLFLLWNSLEQEFQLDIPRPTTTDISVSSLIKMVEEHQQIWWTRAADAQQEKLAIEQVEKLAIEQSR